MSNDDILTENQKETLEDMSLKMLSMLMLP